MDQLESVILFQSKRGLSLPTEICLKIVEEVIAADSKVGTWALMAVSKNFYKLLHKYQYSIVRTISVKDQIHGRHAAILLPSWPRRTGASMSANSYPWLCEVRCRNHTIESLIAHAVTEMKSPAGRTAIDLPIPTEPESEVFKRTELIIREALNLLYSMADSTAATDGLHTTRARQRAYLASLSTFELAMLGILVRVLGLGYSRIAKSTEANKTSDLIWDRWIVFEDRLLRHGPFFAYATAATAPAERRIRNWSDEVIAQGLKDMEAFETGKTEGYASLQSVLWKLFCAKAECDLFDSWEEAKEFVRHRLTSYDV